MGKRLTLAFVAAICTGNLFSLEFQDVSSNPPIHSLDDNISYPFHLLEIENPLTPEHVTLWKNLGYQVQAPLRISLDILNSETLLLSGGMPITDAQGRTQFAKLEHLIHLDQYTKEGPFQLRIRKDAMIFDEEVESFAIHLYSEEVAEEILNKINQFIDKINKKPQKRVSLSVLAEEAGYHHLTHTTRPENLFSILETGQLIAGSQQKEVNIYGDPIGNHDKIFFSLQSIGRKTNNFLHFTGNRLPMLIFPVGVIFDQYPLHANIGYPFGQFILFDVTDGKVRKSAHHRDIHTLRQLLYDPHTRVGNEVVVYHNIPLCGLSGIAVATGEKEELIQKLYEKGIQPPNHLSWERLIFEVTPLLDELVPEHERYATHWLDPYSINSDDIVRYTLQKKELSGESIIDLLCREYPGLQKLYHASAQVHEGYTIKEHTLRFYQKFEEYLPAFQVERHDYSSCTQDIKRLLRIVIALHDIGKPLGPKAEQHHNTLPILQSALERWGFHPREIRLASILVGNDLIGSLVQDRTGRITANEVVNELEKLSRDAGIDIESFWTIQYLLYLSDASSYPYILEHCLVKEPNGYRVPKDPRFHQLTQLLALKFGSESLIVHKESSAQLVPLYSLYTLEREDEKHRYGLDLQKERERYDEYLLADENWAWRHRFWEWLDQEGNGSKIPEVIYLSENEREQYLCEIIDGKVILPPFLKPDLDEELLFVMDKEGKLFIGKKDRGDISGIGFFHSSLVGGEPVIGAGMIVLDESGAIQKITDHSGHYRPSDQQIFQTLTILEEQGVDLSNISLEFETLWETRKYKTRHQIPFKPITNAKEWYESKLWCIYKRRELQQNLDEVVGSQRIIPTQPSAYPHTLQDNDLLKNGKVLVVTTTQMRSKIRVIKEHFKHHLKQIRGKKYNSEDLTILNLDWKSNENQQPYNHGGYTVALYKGSVCEKWIESEEGQKYIRDHQIQHIYWVTITNYIELHDPQTDGPVDYAMMLIKNVNNQKIVSGKSDGVTLDKRFVNEAMKYGYLPKHQYAKKHYASDILWDKRKYGGNVTAGKVMSVHIPGIQHHNWHQIMSGKSREEIMREGIQYLPIP